MMSFFRKLSTRMVLVLGLIRTLPAVALDDFFELYSAPQALMMGNAFSTEASGYTALFHNPAGLARSHKKEWELIPVALEGVWSTGAFSTLVSSKSAGIFNTVRELQKNPNLYHYSRLNFVPTYTRRYFGVAAIGSVTQAAVSDGTNVDLRYSQDVGVAVGGAVPLAGNVIKVGTSLKGLIRNQIQGVFAHTSFQNEQSIRSQMQEGWGVGADIGVQITLPFRYLPTFAFVWQDIFGTHFRPIRILNSLAAQGKPASIAQTANVAFSLEPTLERGVKFLITAEFRHIERTDIPLMQRLHFGAQFEAFRNFYIWLGANQMYPTGGIGTRMPGGNLEFGTYAQDVAPGAGNAADRRILMRYTIGF